MLQAERVPGLVDERRKSILARRDLIVGRRVDIEPDISALAAPGVRGIARLEEWLLVPAEQQLRAGGGFGEGEQGDVFVQVERGARGDFLRGSERLKSRDGRIGRHGSHEIELQVDCAADGLIVVPARPGQQRFDVAGSHGRRLSLRLSRQMTATSFSTYRNATAPKL